MEQFFKSLESIKTAITNPEIVTESRKDVLNTKENGWIVDTCCAFDTHVWETGICPSPDTRFLIVEKYHEGKEQAMKGHEKWVQLMRENPQRTLPNINVFTDEE